MNQQQRNSQSAHRHTFLQCCNPSCLRRVKDHIRSDNFNKSHKECLNFKQICKCSRCKQNTCSDKLQTRSSHPALKSLESITTQSIGQTESTEAQSSFQEDISFSMPDDLALKISECIQKYNGTSIATMGEVQQVVYKIDGKRLILTHDMSKPVNVAGLSMTTLQAQQHLSYADYVKSILLKSDEHRKNLRNDRQLEHHLKLRHNQSIDQKARLTKESNEESSSDSEEQLDDFNQVMQDLEENGWYKGPRESVDENELDWKNPKDFIRLFFMKFSEKRKRKQNSLQIDSSEMSNKYTDWLYEKYQDELQLLYEHTKKQYLMSDEEFKNFKEPVPRKNFTSLDPDLDWRLDNLKCSCGNCFHFSGSKEKTCWVFEELGCDFSVSVLKYFTFEYQLGEDQTPVFDPNYRKQQLPLLLKDCADISLIEFKRMRQQSGILSVAQYRYNLRQIWRAIDALNQNIRQIKQKFGRVTNTNKGDFEAETLKKRKILRSRIRSFEQVEVRRIMKYCTDEIWDEIRNPKTGEYQLKRLKIQVGKKQYTLYPPNTRVPLKRTKKIRKAFKYGLQFSRLFKHEKTQKFRSYVSEQVDRIANGQSVEPFNLRLQKFVLVQEDNIDLSRVEKQIQADKHLRNLIKMPKKNIDINSQQSLSDTEYADSDNEMGQDTSDEEFEDKSDTRSTDSDRSFFKSRHRIGMKQLKKESGAQNQFEGKEKSYMPLAIHRIHKRGKRNLTVEPI